MANAGIYRLVGDARRYQGHSKFEVGYGPAVLDRRRGRGRKTPYAARHVVLAGTAARRKYKGVAKFWVPLQPEVQAAWHPEHRHLRSRAASIWLARKVLRQQIPDTAISIEQITLKPPTVNSRGSARIVRL